MGLEVVVPQPGGEVALAPLLDRLAATGFPTTIMMVDGALVMPKAPPPAAWRDVRLRTPGGMVTLARQPGAVAVRVFGNADAAVVDAQQRVADAVRALA